MYTLHLLLLLPVQILSVDQQCEDDDLGWAWGESGGMFNPEEMLSPRSFLEGCWI